MGERGTGASCIPGGGRCGAMNGDESLQRRVGEEIGLLLLEQGAGEAPRPSTGSCAG